MFNGSDAFCQDGGVGKGGGAGTGNGGAATDGVGGGGSGTVYTCGGLAAEPSVVNGSGWVGMRRGADGANPSGICGVQGWGRFGKDAPTSLWPSGRVSGPSWFVVTCWLNS